MAGSFKEELFGVGYKINDWFVYRANSDLRSNNFNKFTKAINSLQRAGAVSIGRWDYVADQGDYRQNPIETFKRKSWDGDLKGDCEDLAVILTYGFLKNCIDAEILVTWGSESGHAIFHPVGSKYTVCTFNRIQHDEDGDDLVGIAKYWYKNPLGVKTYSFNPDTFEWKTKKKYKVDGDADSGTNKGLKELPYFVRKMSHFDSDFEKDVLNSLKKAGKNEEFDTLKNRLKKLKV